MSVTVEKCIEGWTNTLRQLKVKADIVFFGDSLTYYGNFASAFPNEVVCNLGLRGDTIDGMMKRVEQVKLVSPQVIFLMAGINDIDSSTPEEFRVRYNNLINTLKAETPAANIIIQSLLPVNNRDFIIRCSNEQILICNEILCDLATTHQLGYLDLFTCYAEHGILPSSLTNDGIHIHNGGYAMWFELIKSKRYYE